MMLKQEHGIFLNKEYAMADAKKNEQKLTIGDSNIFVNIVQSEFNFLLKDYGFKCVKAGDFHVSYESNKVFLFCSYQHWGHEIDIGIGELVDSSLSLRNYYTDYELTQLLKIPMIISSGQISVNGVRKYMHFLATVVRNHAKSALKGEHSFFEQLAHARILLNEKYAKSSKINEKNI